MFGGTFAFEVPLAEEKLGFEACLGVIVVCFEKFFSGENDLFLVACAVLEHQLFLLALENDDQDIKSVSGVGSSFDQRQATADDIFTGAAALGS